MSTPSRHRHHLRRQQILESIQHLRLADSVLAQLFFRQDKESTQLLLRIVMDKPNLLVREVRTEELLPNLGRHAVRLDVLATDENGTRYNIEMQLDPRRASAQRLRYYASVLDASLLPEGEDYEQLPEVWVIFICDFDPLGRTRPLYHFVRRDVEENTDMNDGSHLVYVNGTVQDAGTALADLMHDIFCADPARMRIKALAHAVRQYKSSKKGIQEMSGVLEKLAQQVRAEGFAAGMAEGEARGRAAGREEGRAAGREEGRLENSRAIARLLLGVMGQDDRSVQSIAAITNLPVAQVQRMAAERQRGQ